MDKVFFEHDNIKEKVEKLRQDCRTKTELTEVLRKAQIDQSYKLQEAKLEIERQGNELLVKSEEIFEVKKLCDDLKSNLHEKESCLKNLSSAHEKLQRDYGEKIRNLEVQNNDLVSTLDEAMSKIQDLEMKVSASYIEINSLKQLLSVRHVLKAQAPEDVKDGNGINEKLEEENKVAKDELKWKNEQFKHLEEAHEKIHDQFKMSKFEWACEKSEMLKEISSLQEKLDFQTQITEGFQSQLRMCNQALAQEESRRRLLEIEVSECNSRFDDVSLECQEANSKLYDLTVKRDEEIGELRNLLQTKETFFKDLKCRSTQLERENRELKEYLKELQEAQIRDAGSASSLKKLQNDFRGLKKLHEKCSLRLKEKERELTDSRYAYDVLNGEISLLVLVFKSEICELFRTKAELASNIEENEEKILLLREQLESKNCELLDVSVDLREKSERVTVLKSELSEYKKMLEESSDRQLHLREQLLQLERKDSTIEILQTKIRDVEQELANKKLQHELTILDSQKVFDQEKENLLLIVKERDQKIQHLLEQVKILEEDLMCKEIAFTAVETVEGLKTLKIEEKNKLITELEVKLVDTHQKLENLNRSFFDSKQKEVRIKELESREIDFFEENEKLKADMEELLVQMDRINKKFGEVCCEDEPLLRKLEKLSENAEEEKESPLGNIRSDNYSMTPLSTVKTVTDERTPLVELNY